MEGSNTIFYTAGFQEEEEEEEEEIFTAHVRKPVGSGGLIQNINKMDLISALQFLKLNELPKGKLCML